MSQFILASASPRRQQLLTALGYRFRTVPAAVDEVAFDPCPERVCLANAAAKAESVAGRFPAELALGSDTVIEFHGRIIGKPADLDDARRILTDLSGATHEVVTAVALVRRTTRLRCLFCVHTAVTFHRYDHHAIDAYLARVHVLDKAGAYAIQEYGEMLVDRIAGPLDNVVGLPGDATAAALRRCGVIPLD